jgi:uncharacterized protein (DUF2252 family)
VERLDTVKPALPLGKRFWALTRRERAALRRLFEDEDVGSMITSLQERDSDATVEMVDAAYWLKGRSSLRRLRYAVVVGVGRGKSGALCLVDVKEATFATARRNATVPTPRDNAVRVVRGARALSPNLGELIIASRLLGVGVVLRELMLQDLKIDIEQLTWKESTALAGNLAGVVGRAHARQMGVAARDSWQKELAKARITSLDAPSWLWSSVVELLAIHAGAYLDHCRRFALAEAAQSGSG